jgi:allantoin racemase
MTARRIAVIGTGFTATGENQAPPQIQAVVAEGFQAELVEPRTGPFPRSQYDRFLTALGIIDAGIAAANNGAAGIFINTFGDYGLSELRSALSIPVIGAGQSALAMASTLGRRFAIVSIWPRALGFIFEDRIAECGMQARCAEIVHVLADDMADMSGVMMKVGQMRAGQDQIIAAIVSAAQGAIQRGADTIVLGCTCMAPIAGRLARELPVPVVDPMTTGYKATEMMIALNLAHSAHAYPRTNVDNLGLVKALVDGAPQGAGAEDCPVCVIAAD